MRASCMHNRTEQQQPLAPAQILHADMRTHSSLNLATRKPYRANLRARMLESVWCEVYTGNEMR